MQTRRTPARLGAGAVVLIAILAVGPATTRAAPTGGVTAERVAAALAGLDGYAQEALARTGVPGMAIAVVHKDEVVYLKGFGVRDTSDGRPVNADTVFQLASLSKPISSTVISTIVSDGLATWDDPLIKHAPGFALSDPWVTTQVTLRDMFAHRSGLNGNAGNDLEDQLDLDRDTIMERLRYLTPASSFRSTYAYSNHGMTAGGVAAARAAGMTWEEAAAQKLFRPLGMTASSARHADYAAQPNRASIHVLENGAWAPKFKRNADASSPAGGISSSARDLAQWLRLHLGKGTVDGRQLVKPEVLAQTHLPHIVNGINPETGVPMFYGLGWNVSFDGQGRTFLDHSGAWTLGARTQAKLLPAADLGIIVLTNAFPTGLPEAITSGFFDLVLEGRVTRDWVELWEKPFFGILDAFASVGAPYATPPAQTTPALPLSAYTGTYANEYVGAIEIVEQDGGLVLRMGSPQRSLPLRHFDRDVFTQVAFPEPPSPPAGVRFTVGPDQTAQTVALDIFNDAVLGTGQGTLRRVPPSP